MPRHVGWFTSYISHWPEAHGDWLTASAEERHPRGEETTEREANHVLRGDIFSEIHVHSTQLTMDSYWIIICVEEAYDRKSVQYVYTMLDRGVR